MSREASVQLINVTKRFDSTIAVNNLSFSIPEGKFFSLLGPSGCGKTTTLRMIGGLERPDTGDILISGERVNDTPPNERSSNIVFQNYALFPHLTVGENVAFGLRLKGRRVPGPEIEKKVREVLELVHLEGMESRRPSQLSGGQQQRVALARALVLRPKVLLLDEPLGALDRQLRKAMQVELRRIQHEVAITFVYVTHDQDEAMSMSDRVAVMRNGVFDQLGTPQEIFEKPRTRFVADFMGASNIFSGRVVSVGADTGAKDDAGNPTRTIAVETGSGLRVTSRNGRDVAEGASVSFSIRPEIIEVSASGSTRSTANRFEARVVEKIYLGDITELEVALTEKDVLTCRIPSRVDQKLGLEKDSPVSVGWNAEDCNLLSD